MKNIKVALVHDYIKDRSSRFAPIELVVTGQITLFLTGLYLASRTDNPIIIFFPAIVDILVVLVIGVLVSLFIYLLMHRYKKQREVIEWIYSEHVGRSAIWVFLLFPGLISLGEEVFFRGYVQANVGIIMSSVLFSIFHFRLNDKSLIALLSAFLLSIIFGYSYKLTGNLMIPIILHYQFHIFNIYLVRNKIV